jgi:GntR family transcriptional regulator, transcriptional repressor for pyruvate dehydrogenase complex
MRLLRSRASDEAAAGYAHPVFTPIRTLRASEAAVEQISRAIMEGDLDQGDRLPSERTLAWQLQVSRPTLREGIKALADAGVLEVRPGPGGGTFVATDVVPPELRQPQDELRISEISGLLEARRVLEPRVAQLAAVYAREEDFERMRTTIELMRENAHEHDRFHQLDLRFHLEIARATGNQMIIELMRHLLRQLDAARHIAMGGPHDPEWAISIHERTLEAIMARDPEQIEKVMDEHLGYLERFWEEETGRARLRRIPDFLLPHASREGGVDALAQSLSAAAGRREKRSRPRS